MPSLAEIVADPAIGLGVSLAILASFSLFCVVCTVGLWFYLSRGGVETPLAHGAKKQDRLAA